MASKNQPTETTRLLSVSNAENRRLSVLQQRDESESIKQSNITKDEQALGGSTVGERLQYNDYTTIDWLHDLVCL